MSENKVNEKLCKERSGNIEEKVDRLMDNIDHMRGNCLTTISNKLNTLETHHTYTTKSLNEIKQLIKPKDKCKESNTRLAFKIIGILAIIIYLLLSGSIETGKEFLERLLLF